MCNKLKCPVCSSKDVDTFFSEFDEGLFMFICYSCSVNFMQDTQATCSNGICAMYLHHNNKLDIATVMLEDQYRLLVDKLKNQDSLGLIVDISPEEFYKQKLIYGDKI